MNRFDELQLIRDRSDARNVELSAALRQLRARLSLATNADRKTLDAVISSLVAEQNKVLATGDAALEEQICIADEDAAEFEEEPKFKIKSIRRIY